MLERLIDSWLDSASERSYQSPFCQMLAADGHTVIHSTRHTPLEFGKDVITLGPDGIPCAFQLKGNPGTRMTATEFRSIQLQLVQLVSQPIVHPGITDTRRHRCYLVTNGNVEEDVHRALDDLNREFERSGLGANRLTLWSRGNLQEMALRLGASLWPSELENLNLFLTLVARRGDDMFPAKDYHRLISKLLQISSDDPTIGKDELRRRVTSAALLTGIVLRNASQLENHVSAITAWTIFITYTIAAAERHGVDFEVIGRASIEIAKGAIYDGLASLCSEVKENPKLMPPNHIELGMMHTARAMLVQAMMSIYWLWSERTEWEVDGHRDFLLDWIPKDVRGDLIWGEGAVPQCLCRIWFLHNVSSDARSELLLAGLTGAVVDQCQARLPQSLASPYFSFEQVARHVLAQFLLREDPLLDETGSGFSFMAEGLLFALVRSNFKQSSKLVWPDFSRLALKEFRPTHSWQFATIHSDEGVEYVRQPVATKQWADLEKEAYDIRRKIIPEILRSEPFVLLLFVVLFPYRATPEAMNLLGSKFGCVWSPRSLVFGNTLRAVKRPKAAASSSKSRKASRSTRSRRGSRRGETSRRERTRSL